MLNINKELLKNSKKISVLYAEDEEIIREQYKAIFDILFQEVTSAENGLDALEKYKQKQYDLIITDLTMPQMDGITFIKKVLEINPNQHIIIMTAHNTNENLRVSIDFQVDGFLLKPVEKEKLFRLLSKVCYFIIHEKQDALIAEQKKGIDDLVLHQKEDVFIVVIDNFNQIVKKFGIEVKEYILDTVREHLYNFGIEEKNSLKIYDDVILFTESHIYLENILEALQDFSEKHKSIAVLFNHLKIYVTLSYGFIRLQDKKHSNYLHYIDNLVDEIREHPYSKDIVQMDIELEEAKKTDALQWLDTTLNAVKQNAIVPFYQPTFDINELQLQSYEVYARIKQGEKYILPGFFIDLSEKAGILEDISRVLFEHTFERFATTGSSFHINLTNSDLRDHSYVEYLLYLCSRFEIEHKRVILNILNSQEMRVTGKRVGTILIFKELGFQIALKGFTNGDINMELIATIKPNYIKIDQLLLLKSLADKDMKMMLSSLLEIASKADIKTILYNVENREVLDEARALGFDSVQGYLLAKPSETLEQIQLKDI